MIFVSVANFRYRLPAFSNHLNIKSKSDFLTFLTGQENLKEALET